MSSEYFTKDMCKVELKPASRSSACRLINHNAYRCRLFVRVYIIKGRTNERHANVPPHLESRSSRREEAHSISAEASWSLLTSAATLQGFNTRKMVSEKSHPGPVG